MRVFRVSYKDRNGKKRTAQKWYVDFIDHRQVRRRTPGFTDKGQTELLGRKIEKLVVCRQNNEPPDKSLSEWIEHLPIRLRDKFVQFDLLDSKKAAAAVPLAEHLEDFRRLLKTGNTEKYVNVTCTRLERVFDACKFKYFSDIQASKIKEYIASLDISSNTYNFYLQVVKQFCKWMVKDQRAAESPVEYLDRLRTTEGDRRALDFDEVCSLLVATEKAPTRFGMTGHERAVLYLLAIETGLWVRELQSLTILSFDFDNCTVTVEPEFTKNRKKAVQLLKNKRTARLKEFFAGKEPDDKAFSIPVNYMTAKMLRADLQDAGIKFIDDG